MFALESDKFKIPRRKIHPIIFLEEMFIHTFCCLMLKNIQMATLPLSVGLWLVKLVTLNHCIRLQHFSITFSWSISFVGFGNLKKFHKHPDWLKPRNIVKSYTKPRVIENLMVGMSFHYHFDEFFPTAYHYEILEIWHCPSSRVFWKATNWNHNMLMWSARTVNPLKMMPQCI